MEIKISEKIPLWLVRVLTENKIYRRGRRERCRDGMTYMAKAPKFQIAKKWARQGSF